MYGDNRKFLTLAGVSLLIILLLSLTFVSLIKVNRLEDKLSQVVSSSSALPIKKTEAPHDNNNALTEGGISQEEAFFKALDYWDEHQKQRDSALKETPVLNRSEWFFLEALELNIEPLSQKGLWSIYENKADLYIPFFRLELLQNKIILTPRNTESQSFSSLNGKAVKFIENETRRIRAEDLFYEESAQLFQNLSTDTSLQEILRESSCRIILSEEKGLIGKIEIVTNSEDRLILALHFDRKKRYINNQPVTGTIQDYSRQVKEQLRSADTRPESAIAHEKSLSLIRNMYEDVGFVKYLEDRGLYPRWQVREDDDFSYLDLVDSEGRFRAAFGVKKQSGRIYMINENCVPLTSLESLMALSLSLPGDTLSENLSQYNQPVNYGADPIEESSGSTFSILLVGYHNSGTDTMILAHIQGDSRKISLISIPRDIWWEGQKINAYYFGSSRESLLEVISEITGIRVDYYLSVDMYAFIDVVNAMDGVDITLESSVIDPTYRIVREDGSEGTLYYAPGIYHLNGVEALRLARSRHGSSDFDRSALQQQILSSMKEKINSMTLFDADLFRQFLSIGLENGETNMSLPFIMKNLLACRDYELDTGHTLYDESVLYNSYSNYYGLSAKEKEIARNNENFNWGQWILLPVNNDWNLIRARVKRILGIGEFSQ